MATGGHTSDWKHLKHTALINEKLAIMSHIATSLRSWAFSSCGRSATLARMEHLCIKTELDPRALLAAHPAAISTNDVCQLSGILFCFELS